MFLSIVGFIALFFAGLVMGLLGGGGSILAVPILAYLFKLSALTSTAYSLFMVGCSAIFASFRQKQYLNIAAGLSLSIPGLLGTFFARSWILPHLPDPILSLGSWHMAKGSALMFLFAAMMLLAAKRMLKQSNKTQTQNKNTPSLIQQSFIGLGIGILTGLVGAGGGFILVPVLLLIFKLDMRQAIATSVFVISINALVGFTGDLLHSNIDWPFLIQGTLLMLAGIFLGTHLSPKIEKNKLKKAFAYFIVVLAIFIIVREML